ncbi:hypothetical protein HYC85_006199 [Camellia sinensis]|uniref:Uncharacterized protein n=1 Tax=Camellia sinensis TaxID=4442 RepID=A0A7J7HKH8_CAMSI|nr:hypothetical protein HYC85_006199 [Camellia sinensis]
MQIWVPSNPRGAEILPPAIVAAESDFYLRRLWGTPSELVGCDTWCLIKWAFAGPNYQTGVSCNLYSSYDQRHNIDAVVKKVSLSLSLSLFVCFVHMHTNGHVLLQFSENFTILLFHYDGRTTEWNEFEWSKRAIHVSALKQTKLWCTKRFLYLDIVAPYDYIFIWDGDLEVEHFNVEE